MKRFKKKAEAGGRSKIAAMCSKFAAQLELELASPESDEPDDTQFVRSAPSVVFSEDKERGDAYTDAIVRTNHGGLVSRDLE